MRILIVDRYFLPDTAPYAMIVHPIAKRWVQDGHEVTVLASQPSYSPSAEVPRQPRREVMDGIVLTRVGLIRERTRGLFVRTINLLIYAFHASLRILSDRRFDVIMVCTTNPIILPMIISKLSKLIGARFIYHCQDLFPEAAMITGLLNPGFVYNFLSKIDGNTCTSANSVVVLSDDMRRELRARKHYRPSNIVVINNFVLPSTAHHRSLPSAFSEKSNTFRVLFAGNIGKLQGVEYLVRAGHLLEANDDITIHIVGDGVAKEDIVELARPLLGNRIFMHDHQPISVVREMIANANLCVISLARTVYKVAYPSKMMTTLSAGGRILACVEAESEISRLILRERLGYVVDPEDYQAMATAILQAKEENNQLEGVRVRAKTVAAERFGEGPVLGQWSQLIPLIMQES